MSTIGELIDAMSDLDKKVDVYAAKIKKLNQKRALLEKKLMRAFEKQGIDKASGKDMHAMSASRRFPSIKDLNALTKYIKKRNAFDLFQRRINAKAYFDRLEQGDAVPGVDVFDKHYIKLTPKRG